MPLMQTAPDVAVAVADERNWLLWTAFKTGQVLLFVLSLALLVAALVLADRKIWAAVQMRRGPNVVGAFGLLQTIADALKFFFKEIVIPGFGQVSLYSRANFRAGDGFCGLGCGASRSGMGDFRH